MKLTAILVLISLFQIHANSYAQNKRISLDMRQVSVARVIQEIEHKSDFKFLLNRRDVDLDRTVSIRADKEPIKKILSRLFKGTGISFELLNKQIILRQIVQGNVSLNPNGGALDRKPYQLTISGTITDANGVPLLGASVIEKGTMNGTAADFDGIYALEVSGPGVVLVFSSLGFTTQEMTIGNETTINVSMEEDAEQLEEVVVTSLGIKREKRSLTYRAENVNIENLTEARDLNVMNSLQGKVAGLTINSSGSGLGSDSRVILRGNRSISGDSQPLYVIDGVPVRDNPSNLSQDNIASLTVLKGANAAALYGSAAQNGVIIIETKRGTRGVVDLSLSHTSQILSPIHSIEFQNEYAQGISNNYISSSESSWGPKIKGQLVDHWSIDPVDAGKQYALRPQANNVRDFFQTGLNTATNLVASMGGEKIQGIFSLTRTDAKGNVPRNTLTRNNISVRITGQPMDRLTVDGKIDFMGQNIYNPLYQDVNNFNQIKQIYSIPRNISTVDAMNATFYNDDGVIMQNYWNPGSTLGLNPYFLNARATSLESRQRTIVMASLTYDFTKNLKLMIRGSYDGGNTSSEEKLSKDFYSRALNGRYTISKGFSSVYNGDFLLSYSKEFKKDWSFDINIGGNNQQRRNNYLSSNTNVGLVVPDFFSLSNTLLPITSYAPGPKSDIQSIYGFANIGWKNAIFFDITGRNDWSSTLPSNNRSYFYPSVGISTVLTDLLKMPDFISYAKLSGSWAKVGNGGPPYMLARDATFSSGGANGFLRLSSILPNPNLRPEQTNSLELGIDLSLFNNRLGLNASWYKTNTVDQLFTVALPPGSGASQYFTNGGNVENKGIELLLTTIPLKTQDFRWDMNINYSRNRNLVRKLNDERPKLIVGSDQSFRDFVVIQGQPFGEIYSVGFLRDEQGRVVVGENGIPLDTGARTVSVANANPDWMGGFTNTISYKNFNLNFLIDHRQGGSAVSITNAMLFYEGNTVETLQGREGGLVFGENFFSGETAVKEDGSTNDVPVDAQTFWRNIGGTVNPIGEAFVEELTNTRLRELILGYSFPKSITDRMPISGLELSLVGRNLFFLYRASRNVDPDIIAGSDPTAVGKTAFAPPTTRSFGINLKINL